MNLHHLLYFRNHDFQVLRVFREFVRVLPIHIDQSLLDRDLLDV